MKPPTDIATARRKRRLLEAQKQFEDIESYVPILPHMAEHQRTQAKLLRQGGKPKRPKVAAYYKPMVQAMDAVADFMNQRLIKAGVLQRAGATLAPGDVFARIYTADIQQVKDWCKANPPTNEELQNAFD